jgi:hypothetical protein
LHAEAHVSVVDISEFMGDHTLHFFPCEQ